MRDAQPYLWQTATYLLLAIALTVLSLDIGNHPFVVLYVVCCLLPFALSLLNVRRQCLRLAASCILFGAAVYGAGLGVAVYSLLVVVTPASVGLVGLLLGCVLSFLLAAAAFAAITTGRLLWRAAPTLVRPHLAPQGSTESLPAT